jgi:hypothetical protein
LVTTDERPKERGRHQPDRCCAPPVAAVEAHDLHPSGPVSENPSLIEGHVLKPPMTDTHDVPRSSPVGAARNLDGRFSLLQRRAIVVAKLVEWGER